MSADWQSALERARAHSPFLRQALERQPELAELLAGGKGDQALAWARQAGAEIEDAGVALRREKLALATSLAVGDLAGDFPVGLVMHELSEFADRALDRSIAAAIARRMPDVEPAGILALALGKHGAGELNYSSDIDPILLYDPATLPRRDRDEPGEAAQRYARDLVEIMSANTADGYVFRVDLRLRPASEVSPLAISLNAAITHYESSALTWERAAFIRARACAGEVAQGEEFLAHIRPFVWRRSLDFGAIEEIRRLTARIRANYKGPPRPGPGFNLKHGRGGIREVEFYAQTHQLIHGGRDPSLRLRGTRAALDALATAGIIPVEDARVLGESYDRLRILEHRLQMVDDQQTHALPSGEALDNVARLHGLSDAAALVAEIEQVTEEVGRRFDALIEEESSTSHSLPAEAGTLSGRLEELGFDDPRRLAERIEGWCDGRIRALRSEAAQRAFEDCLPVLLEALAGAPDPDQAILRWEKVIAALPSAINLFRLLEARPGLLRQLIDILTLAPPLADELARRPELLDALIDRSALDLPGSVEQLSARMRRSEADRGYEGLLDRIRIVTGETRYALGVQLIEAAHSPLEIAGALCRTAEAAMQVALEAAEEEFARTHGRIAGSELLVLGLGRLGGGVLTHASDLDIVYLFTGSHDGESDGDRPLGATLYFNRLAQRVSAALSVPTAEGALYEVDTRLRPQGNQGPLAASLESFAKYQREDAWTWEHMALCRARPVAGSVEAREAVTAIVSEVLSRERDAETLRRDVLKMRSEMAGHKPASGPLDVKLLRGGLVDVEFLTHYLQLRERRALVADLALAIAELVEAALMPKALIAANELLTGVLVASRLLAPDRAIPAPAAAEALARACGSRDMPHLLDAIGDARRAIADAWSDIFGETLETDR
jgi:glutamate-ammonia-ligase adenylyltransferase